MKHLKQKSLDEINSNSDIFDTLGASNAKDDLEMFQYDTGDAGLIYLAY